MDSKEFLDAIDTLCVQHPEVAKDLWKDLCTVYAHSYKFTRVNCVKAMLIIHSHLNLELTPAAHSEMILAIAVSTDPAEKELMQPLIGNWIVLPVAPSTGHFFDVDDLSG